MTEHDNPARIHPFHPHCLDRDIDYPWQKQQRDQDPIELERKQEAIASVETIERTLFDNKSSIESIVNGIKNSRLIIGSICLDKICDSVGNLFVWIRCYQLATIDNLEMSQ